MKKLSSEEKAQLQEMLTQQRIEQDKKRRKYRNYKSVIHSSRYSGDAEERIGKLEERYDKVQRQVAKHSELKAMHLTPWQKRTLQARIQESMNQ